MSEAVKVVVKCRPMNRRETEMSCRRVVEVDPSTGQCSIARDGDAPRKTFTFDAAYAGDATNEQLYVDIAFPLVEGVTEGYNGTMFAYGQTGGGKTFTMQGASEPGAQRGLIPRAFHHIFDTVAVAERTRYLIHASFLEIYNEEIRDLLGDDTAARLELRERPDGGVFVRDLSLHAVASVAACERVMSRGWKNRATAATLMNAASSRSHCIFTVHLERCDDASSRSKIRASKLNLVDLAGSERQSKTGAVGDRLKEATKINLSLSALGNVISALVDGRSVHVPYRDSKLTRLLQDSLGGNTKTLMIACLSPADNNYEETLSTLRYANRAKNIKNKPRINEDPKDALIRQYLEEINRLKAMLSEAPPGDTVTRPPTPEPQIVEKIVRVPDEEEIRAKTKQIEVEYEKKMQKMAAELAEARASGEQTAAEMARLRAEAEAKQRELRDDYAVRVESQRARLQQQFDAEMERVRRELESTRRGKELVQAEMDALRRQYEAAMFSAENSVPPQQLEAERERLRSEYEANMKVMRDELEAVKTARASVESEMDILRRTKYVSSVEQSSTTVASASTSAALLSTASDYEQRRQNLTDEMKIESADSLNRLQMDDRADIASDKSAAKQRQSGSDVVGSVQSKLVKDSVSKYSSDPSVRHQETQLRDNVREPSPVDVEQLENEVAAGHETAVSALKTELEGFKRSRDAIAKVIYRIKTEYQEAVSCAEETVPRYKLDVEKQEIRAKYELQMDRVKEDLKVLKCHRDIVNLQLAEETSAWKNYEEERQKIEEDVEAGRVERGFAPAGLINAAAQRYLEETRRLSGTAAADKEKVQTKVISERFEREKRRIDDDLEAGTLTETEFDYQLERLMKARTAELNAVREQAGKLVPPVADDLDRTSAMNFERKSSTSRSQSRTGARSGQCRAEAGDAAAARRLKALEDILVRGGSGGADTERCRAISEKLRRERINAEEKQRRVQQARKSTSRANAEANVESALYDVFASARDEIVAKTTALELLRSQNEQLQREIGDIQAEFEFDRIDYLDTIRTQDRTLKWYQSVLERIVPALRRDCNYADLERVSAQSAWDALNERWQLPKFIVEKKLTLPPVSYPGRTSATPSPAASSSFSDDLDFELRSEERLIDKLSGSAMRDPAAAYFSRAGSASTVDRPSPPAAGRSSRNLAPKAATPVRMSPLFR